MYRGFGLTGSLSVYGWDGRGNVGHSDDFYQRKYCEVFLGSLP